MKKRLSGHEKLMTQEDMTNVLSTQIDIYALGVTLYYIIFREKPPQDSILFGDMQDMSYAQEMQQLHIKIHKAYPKAD